MPPYPSITGTRVHILGAGRSGKAAAALALRQGARVSAFDTAGPETFAGMPDGVTIHPHATPASAQPCDTLIVSPGIDPACPVWRAFAEHASEVIGEVELAARHYSGTIIAVTGTNGKTTTTELIGRILAIAGLGGNPCGNYGTPFAEVAMLSQPPAAVALELSSFQLETIRTLRPNVAVWLNFAADHMDRYPSLEAYRAAKLRIFKNQTPEDHAVVRHGEALPPLSARVTSFSSENTAADWFSDGSTIRHGDTTILNLATESALRGLHNAENAMAAIIACQKIGIPVSVIRKAFQEFAPPPHRCELIRTLDGVEYLNDSKATNLHALESAIRSQTRPVVLIAGGKDKGLDYSPLAPLLKANVAAAVTFGEIAAPLGRTFAGSVHTQIVRDLHEAVTAARALARRGSTILFSPGTSSFDQFRSYEHRGDTFRDLVHQLR